MRKSLGVKACLAFSLASILAACDPPHYVENNGISYYDANDVPTDTLPSGPYTKGGQYINNPEEATDTRDNRGMRPQGYGHDVNEDYRTPSPATAVYPAGTMIYGDGTVVYPGGAVYPAGHTTTTETNTVIETSP